MSSGTFRVPSPSTFTSNVLFIFPLQVFPTPTGQLLPMIANLLVAIVCSLDRHSYHGPLRNKRSLQAQALNLNIVPSPMLRVKLCGFALFSTIIECCFPPFQSLGMTISLLQLLLIIRFSTLARNILRLMLILFEIKSLLISSKFDIFPPMNRLPTASQNRYHNVNISFFVANLVFGFPLHLICKGMLSHELFCNLVGSLVCWTCNLAGLLIISL